MHELPEILLDEPWTHVYIELHERLIADAREAVHLARLDDEYVPRTCLELFAVHRVAATALTNELDLVVGMTMRTRAAAGLAIEEEHGDSDISLVGADEVVRAPAERQIFLANAMHEWVCFAMVESEALDCVRDHRICSATASKNFQSSMIAPPVGLVCAPQTTITNARRD